MARAECAYCEVDDVKNRPGEQWTSGLKWDTVLEDWILSASRLIDREVGWLDCHFAAVDLTPGQTRYFDTEGGTEIWIPRCTVINSLKLDFDGDGTYETTWTESVPPAVADFVVWPYDGYSFDKIIVQEGSGNVFPVGQKRMEIQGEWGGFAIPPQIIKEACVITVFRWYKRATQMYQDTGAIVELGQLTYTKALDPDVQEALRVSARRVAVG